MNHQPFEAWLLEDKALTPAEKRELDLHLRECKTCTALAETGLALRSTRAIAPKAGFALRFQERLILQKAAERRQRLWGMFVLVLGGMALFLGFLAPFVSAFISAPVEWLISASSLFLFVFSSLQAFGELFAVVGRMLPDFLPPYAWMVMLSALAGLGLLWTVSIWRIARPPQGVTA